MKLQTLEAKRDLFFLYLPSVGIVIIIKWMMIPYGLPYHTHVDEMTILTDPFKIIQMYVNGDFSISTNLFNWICLGWYGIIFLAGKILGHWEDMENYKIFLISGSSEVLLAGRILSAILSFAGTMVLVRLIKLLKTEFFVKILCTGLVIFNPFELNSTNWVKFDALSYLGCAVILYMGYRYFIEQRIELRSVLYVVLFIGVSARIELIAFLSGFLVYDLFFFRPFNRGAIPWKALGYGVAIYFGITLLPISYLYRFFSPEDPLYSVTPTFYEAIITKIPPPSEIIKVIGGGWYYVVCLFALLGPAIFIHLFLKIKMREIHFLVLPLLIMLAVLLIFPIKNVHYLMGVSVIILVAYILCLARGGSGKWQSVGLVVSVIWIVSYSVQLLGLIYLKTDARIDAREYLMTHTVPGELIYVDGIFAAIPETPERYVSKSNASKLIGGTGMSNEYMATHVNPLESRKIVTVSYWEPFKNTPYENVFNNMYDTLQLKSDRPAYYTYVTPSYWTLDISESTFYEKNKLYYRFLEQHYFREKVFSYCISDPRLHFTNAYYLRSVIIFRRSMQY